MDYRPLWTLAPLIAWLPAIRTTHPRDLEPVCAVSALLLPDVLVGQPKDNQTSDDRNCNADPQCWFHVPSSSRVATQNLSHL